MNRVFLIGNLGADAEVKALPSGEAVCNFRLATSEKFKNRAGEQEERTEWHTCTLFGKRAEALGKYLTKGKKILVEGSIRYRTYEKDGQTRHATDIRVDNVELLGSNAPVPATDNQDTQTGPDNIPF